MLNRISIHGRLTADPEFRETQSGVSCCNFTVAVDRNFAKQGEEKQTDFFRCVAWRSTAEFINKFFSKGKEIVLCGSMQMDNYTDKDGNKRTAWNLMVDNAEFCGGKESSGAGKANANIETEIRPSASIGLEEIDDEDLPF